MSPAKRQPSKQKRTAQNRQQRAALQARKQAASATMSGGPTAGGGRRSLLGRLRGPRAATPTQAPVAQGAATPIPGRRGAGPGGQPVGYRAALAGLLAAGAAVLLCFVQTTPVNAQGDLYTSAKVVAEWSTSALEVAQARAGADPEVVAADVEEWSPGRTDERLVQALYPVSLALALPLLATYLTFRAVRNGRPARVVTRGMYATLLGAFLTMSLFIFFLPTVIAITIASFQVRKAEAMAVAAANADAGGAGTVDGEVIDAEVVDAEVIDAEATGAEIGDDGVDDHR